MANQKSFFGQISNFLIGIAVCIHFFPFVFTVNAFRYGQSTGQLGVYVHPNSLTNSATLNENRPSAFTQQQNGQALHAQPSHPMTQFGFPVNLTGKTAFVAGVADNHGYGWAICKYLKAAGAKVIVGTWPPVYGMFEKGLSSGKFTKENNSIGQVDIDMHFEKIYPLDAQFDYPEDVPEEIKNNKRYAGHEGYTISEVAKRIASDFGKIDIVVHSLANGPEVTKPLSETSRKGYLAASSSSAYSFVSLLKHFKDIMNPDSSALALSYIASEKVIPGYGGGMSSAKAALESDCRTLAYELGQSMGMRINCISAGPLKSRAASAIGKDSDKAFIDYAIDYSINNAPIKRDLQSDDIGSAALFLLSPMSRAVSGVTLHVDNGLHAMGQALDSKSLERN